MALVTRERIDEILAKDVSTMSLEEIKNICDELQSHVDNSNVECIVHREKIDEILDKLLIVLNGGN